MVYCGKPSSACRHCRKRNVKCDKKRESCGQCRRAQLLCPGYHNPRDLVFRDETRAVLKKITGREPTPIPTALLSPLEDRAKHLFISRYVLDKSAPFDYMSTFWPASLDTHLTVTIRAVSLANLSTTELLSSSAPVLEKARRRYGVALELTNKALRSPETATKNTMLHTVLLLALFEKLTRNDRSSIEAESRHLDGAMTLAKLRGPGELDDPIFKRMMLQLYSMVATNYQDRQIEVPPNIILTRQSLEGMS